MVHFRFHFRDSHFIDAIETLQHIKTKFTAFEKLTVIVDTFRKVNAAGMEAVGKDFCWSMDELFPVFQVCKCNIERINIAKIRTFFKQSPFTFSMWSFEPESCNWAQRST